MFAFGALLRLLCYFKHLHCAGCEYHILFGRKLVRMKSGKNRQLRLPCHVDSALTFRGRRYVIKDDMVWTLDVVTNVAISQEHLDAWNLCSWKICTGEVTDTFSHMVAEVTGHSTLLCNGDARCQ